MLNESEQQKCAHMLEPRYDEQENTQKKDYVNAVVCEVKTKTRTYLFDICPKCGVKVMR
jgi:hypothetical protein